MIKIIMADDHQIVLDGLKLLLTSEEDIEVIATAENGKEVMKLLENTTADIAVLDVEMPELNGVETAERIRQQHPDTKVLILTMHNDQAFIRSLIEIGVSGYILKNKGKEELVEAIHDIAAGKTFFGREVTNALISGIQRSTRQKPNEQVPLTKREVEVLAHIADGHTTPQIADKLFIAPSLKRIGETSLIKPGWPIPKRSSSGPTKMVMPNSPQN